VSMKLMVKAMETKVGNPLTKLVLLKIADNANDDGVCWPSYGHIADQCEITKRSAINHINKLIEAGLVTKQVRTNGYKSNSSNVYTVLSGSEPNSPPSESNAPPSEPNSPPPSEPNSPRTSHSLEPVKEPAVKSIKPDDVEDQVWMDFVDLRKAKKARVSKTALKRIQGEAQRAGWTLNQALEEVVSRGWQSFKADWVSKQPIPSQTQDIQSNGLPNGLPKGMRWVGGAR